MENQLVFDGNQGVAQPAGDILNIIGDGVNITVIARGNTLLITQGDCPVLSDVSVKKISLPKTNPSASEGALYVDGKLFMHSFSTGGASVYLGPSCGNASNGSQSNVVVGVNGLNKANNANFNTVMGESMNNFVQGNFNSSLGYGSLMNLKNGSANVALGAQAGAHLDSSSYNVLVGANAGLNYSSGESNNVIVGNTCGSSDESNVVRLGNDGSSPGVPASAKVYVYGIAHNIVSSEQPVYINTQTGQLGTQSSSQKVKANVKQMSSASDLLHKLNPVTFNYKGVADDVTHFGLKALWHG